MSAPFGFSIGDFIAVGDLARRIAKALGESRGSTADYKSLCEALFSLDRSLQVASAIFFHLSLDKSTKTNARGSPCSPDIGPLNGIRHEIGCCKQLMENFLVSSRKFTEALSNGQGSRVKTELRKIGWCLFKTEDIQKLQGGLTSHIDAFNIYASVIMRQGVARTEQKASEISETAHRIEKNTIELSETSHRVESVLREAFTALRTLQGDMPKIMGHIWEGGCVEDRQSIELQDALGRTLHLPLLLCDDYQKFHTLLGIIFKGHPGQKRVTQREYEVMDTLEGTIICSSEWGTKVSPGARVSMSVLIKTMFNSTTRSELSAHHCPRCSGPSTSGIPEKESLKCHRCQLVFRTTDSERIVELPDNSLEEPKTEISQESASSELGEEYAFRRIHYLREVLKHKPTKRHEREHSRTRKQAGEDGSSPRLQETTFRPMVGLSDMCFCPYCGFGP